MNLIVIYFVNEFIYFWLYTDSREIFNWKNSPQVVRAVIYIYANSLRTKISSTVMLRLCCNSRAARAVRGPSRPSTATSKERCTAFTSSPLFYLN